MRGFFLINFVATFKHMMIAGIMLFIGGPEIFFILLIVVMLFGADKIPEIARGLGKGIKEVRHAANEIKDEISNSTSKNDDLKKFKEKVEKEKKEIEEITGSIKRGFKG